MGVFFFLLYKKAKLSFELLVTLLAFASCVTKTIKWDIKQPRQRIPLCWVN